MLTIRKNFTFIVATLIALVLTFSSAHATVIDTFETAQSQTADSGVPIDNSTVSGSGILGGSRELTATWNSGLNVHVEADAGGNGLLTFDTGVGTDGVAESIWRPKNIPIIKSADLTDGGTHTGIAVDVVFDDKAVDLDFIITSGGGATSTATLSLAGGISSLTTAFLPFSSFSGIADFTQVKTITMLIDPLSPETILRIDIIETAIPEPATLSLLVLGAIGLIRRRKA